MKPAPEDDFCGDYIESILIGKQYDHITAVNNILSHKTALKFLHGDISYLPQTDVVLCLQRDVFDFALVARKQGNITFSVKCKK